MSWINDGGVWTEKPIAIFAIKLDPKWKEKEKRISESTLILTSLLSRGIWQISGQLETDGLRHSTLFLLTCYHSEQGPLDARGWHKWPIKISFLETWPCSRQCGRLSKDTCPYPWEFPRLGPVSTERQDLLQAQLEDKDRLWQMSSGIALLLCTACGTWSTGHTEWLSKAGNLTRCQHLRSAWIWNLLQSFYLLTHLKGKV